MKSLLFAMVLVTLTVSASAVVGGNGAPPSVPPTVTKPGCNKSGGSSKPAEKPAPKPAPKKSAPERR